jgi:hypothetical protein
MLRRVWLVDYHLRFNMSCVFVILLCKFKAASVTPAASTSSVSAAGLSVGADLTPTAQQMASAQAYGIFLLFFLYKC